MKLFAGWIFIGLLALSSYPATAQETPSPLVSDVLKLASAGIGDEVIFSFIRTSREPGSVSAEDILALKNAHVGDGVIQALLARNPAPQGNTAQPKVPDPDPRVAPAPLYDQPPMAPGPGYTWYPGHWAWAGGWYWVPGNWGPQVIFMPRFYRWQRW